MGAAAEWAEQLGAWSIPKAIIAAAPESPWGFPVELFDRRAAVAAAAPPSASAARALEALPVGGTVLDVGCGGGAASLPLARRASTLVGVDPSAELLAAFLDAAQGLGVAAATVEGQWPEVAPRVEAADVVVCNHVAYNVPMIEPFVQALTSHARARVVMEMTTRHPLAWMNDLWLRFHDLERPSGPTADDALAVLREIGVDAHREDETRTDAAGSFTRREDAVALVRRRLCLSPDRDAELADALGDRLTEHDGLWSVGPPTSEVAVMRWDTA